MLYAKNGIIPSFIGRSDEQNIYGYTVAMYLAENGIIPPK